MRKKPDSYTRRDAAALTSIPYAIIDHYAREGLLEPTIAPTGKSKRWHYSYADLVALMVLRLMKTSGVNARFLQKVVTYIRQIPMLEHAPTGMCLYIDSEGNALHGFREQVEERFGKDNQFMITLGIGTLVSNLRTRLAMARGECAVGDNFLNLS